MESKKIFQKIRKVYPDSLEVALKYYAVLFVLNGIKLPPRQVQLIAFTAVKGSISAGGAREEFVKRFKSSIATVNNNIAILQEEGYLVKNAGKITVNPRIVLDFESPLSLQLNLSYATNW